MIAGSPRDPPRPDPPLEVAPAALPPYPTGWFAIAFASELGARAVLTRRLGERELVVFRTERGEIAAVDPICPHMGAHLGHGGTVEGESIRCPFHAFRFGADGACVATGYGTRPPKARLRTHAVIERNGFVLVWHGPGDPEWDVPPLPLEGHTPMKEHRFHLRGHPQETTENSVDIGHLSVVHGYEAVEQTGPLETDGAHLNVQYSMRRPVRVLGRAAARVTADFEIHVHGLGYSFVEAKVRGAGIEFRHFLCATPVGGGEIDLRLGISLRRLGGAPGLLRPLGGIGPIRAAVEEIVLDQTFRAFKRDVAQDFAIWNHKAWVPNPALAPGDGPVARYRRWAIRFYP
jgi:nitrite reductase/ring-hydroxylating ferredoxin subunit